MPRMPQLAPRAALPRAPGLPQFTAHGDEDIELDVLYLPAVHSAEDGDSASLDIADTHAPYAELHAANNGPPRPAEISIGIGHVGARAASRTKRDAILRALRQFCSFRALGAAGGDDEADGAQSVSAVSVTDDVEDESDIGNNPLRVVGWIHAKFLWLAGLPPAVSFVLFMALTVASIAGAFYVAFKFSSPQGTLPLASGLLGVLGCMSGYAAWYSFHSVR
ncbi:hypothetical protein AURDEDRAFT_131230 [Auricularia subglabra TFB-10046 SS5]|uniref:Uncharacterized protein n=1 Tax=Auricularia subglabra (strain TFB-10046 / SS5) TaxID=717982 RepID=J0CV83_AURST|nr:hypothetical protein AURDEDRAFT_131230 [Auricularia subglabra TFB-10046 SS5]